jgi:S-adenosylmethionine synthetase
MAREYLLSTEAVSGGHPDKLADQISDAVLDEALEHDPRARVACETLVTQGIVFIAGEITAGARIDYDAVARRVIRDVGYTDISMGLDYKACRVISAVHNQATDIADGVFKDDGVIGAGDQGIMYGFACDETPEMMPLGISLCNRMMLRHAELLRSSSHPWLRPDAKCQVTVHYTNNRPHSITTVVFSTQHSEDVTRDELKEAVIRDIIGPVIPEELRDGGEVYYINPTGRFVMGGPQADTGLTGRKIIADSYGAGVPHGGGAFSGKDPTKVDRSAAYMARYIAKNIVAAGLAGRCTVQLAYAISIPEPVSLMVDLHGTGRVDEAALTRAITAVFRLDPAGIIETLDLRCPIYEKTSCFGHFGRELPGFTWEKTDKTEELKRALCIKGGSSK